MDLDFVTTFLWPKRVLAITGRVSAHTTPPKKEAFRCLSLSTHASFDDGC